MDLGILLICVITALICVYPFIYTLSVSISDPLAVTRGEVVFLPKGFSLSAYRMLLSHPNLIHSYGNTLFYTVVGTLWSLVITSLAGYALSKRSFPGKKLINGFIVLTMLFSGGLIPTFLVVTELGLFNTRLAIILINAVSVWNLIILRTFMQSIPVSLKESARVDGAGEWRVFFSIYLPMCKPAVSIIALFFAVARWNDFFTALIYLIDEVKFPVQLVIRALVISMTDKMGSANASGSSISQYAALSFRSAVLVVTMLPVMLIYPFIQKYFTKGIMVGAIKG